MFTSLISYLNSIKARDPAPYSLVEIMLYPGVQAVGLHRFAHWLYKQRLYFLARLVNCFSRFMTAIDIHPGAKIGKRLFIDHGFVVIGESAEIGDDVTIYQGVTLGGRNPTNGVSGKRHPTIEDGVIISLGACILGPVTVAKNARITAQSVVTHDVSEGSIVGGNPAAVFRGGKKITDECFVPYGPCSEKDSSTQGTLVALERKIAQLTKALEELKKIQPAPVSDPEKSKE